MRLSGVRFPAGPGRCKVDIICIEPPRGVTLPCREHWQDLVTQLLGGTLIEFQKFQKVSLMLKLNSDTNGIQTADPCQGPWVMWSKPDALHIKL